MIYIEMLQDEDIKRFYKEKSNYDNALYFDYNAEGNLVEYKKTRKGRGDPKKTIVLPTYTPSTAEDIKEDDLQYRAQLQEAIEQFNQARARLQMESRNPDRTMESVLKANQEVAEADEALIYARFRKYEIDIIQWNNEKIPLEKRMKVRQLLFEKTDQDRIVDTDIAMISTQLYPLQRMFKKVDKSTVSLSEAKDQEVEKQMSIKKANKVLSALGIPSIGKKVASAKLVTSAATTSAKPVVKEKSLLQSLSNTVTSAVEAVVPKAAPKAVAAPIIRAPIVMSNSDSEDEP
jgi:hypothetical protein